jgi:ribosomal protein L11 methylase PrmA
MHLHWHAWAIQRHADTSSATITPAPKPQLSRLGLDALLDSLRRAVQRLHWRPSGTEWADYETAHGYTQTALEQKKQIVAAYLQQLKPGTVWDLGANVGLFSRLACAAGARVVAFDIDPACVERNFLQCRQQGTKHLLPLVLDLANPSPALGWAHQERSALAQRGPVDVVMALALVHHLAIGNNLPFEMLAEWFRRIGRHLILEFVPKGDPQAARLLRSREDVFTAYHAEGFEKAFAAHFRIVERRPVGESGRILYLFSTAAQ